MISPFFILGCQRSGTTMLRLMMDAHPQLFVPFECDFLAVAKKYPSKNFPGFDLREVFLSLMDEPYTKKGAFLESEFFTELHACDNFSDFFNQVMTLAAGKNDKSRWGVKTPGYHIRLDELWRLYPGCKIIHIVRDGRAIAISQRNISWGNKNLLNFAINWNMDLRVAHKMGNMIADNYFELRYEDLVAEPEHYLKNICEFIDVKYSPVMLDYHLGKSANMPKDSLKWHNNSISKPDISKIDEWVGKMSNADKKIFQDNARFGLDHFGYQTTHYKYSFSAKLKKLYYLYFAH